MEITRLTSKHQATVPADVRKALKLKAGDAVVWRVDDGVAKVTRMSSEDYDWLKMSEESFAVEWLSPEDEEAWRDL